MVDANGAPPDYFDFALIPAGNVVTPQTGIFFLNNETLFIYLF